MRLIIDANIIFAALIKDSLSRKLIRLAPIQLFSPEFVIQEIKKYRARIKKKGKLTDAEFDFIQARLLEKIRFTAKTELNPYFQQAKQISPDSNDAHYFALALKLKIPIWSNDTLLKKQSVVQILTTAEVLELLQTENAP